MLQKYCTCHEKVEPRHTNCCNCHAKWSPQSNVSVTWNLQPFHGFSVRGFKLRHHSARNPCACHAKSIISDSLLKSTAPANLFATLTNPCACHVFCNVSKSLRLPREKHLEFHFWRKSRRNASFWSFKVSILKDVSGESFVFEPPSFIFEGSLPQKLRFWASKLQITWISNQLTTKSLESQTNWQPNHCNRISTDQLTTALIYNNQNHLNLRSFGIQTTWISNQMTTKSLESHSRWQPYHWNRKSTENHTHLNLKSTDNQNHLNLRSTDNQITWISNQMTT